MYTFLVPLALTLLTLFMTGTHNAVILEIVKSAPDAEARKAYYKSSQKDEARATAGSPNMGWNTDDEKLPATVPAIMDLGRQLCLVTAALLWAGGCFGMWWAAQVSLNAGMWTSVAACSVFYLMLAHLLAGLYTAVSLLDGEVKVRGLDWSMPPFAGM